MREDVFICAEKVWAKIKNQRADFHHKTARYLVNNFDFIAIEKLRIKNMVKNRHLSKAISDVAWSSFFQILKNKVVETGRELKEVNPNKTSQTCICGERVEKILSVRWHKCDKCGLSEHRDIVSAKVILQRAEGQTVKESTWAVASCVSFEA